MGWLADLWPPTPSPRALARAGAAVRAGPNPSGSRNLRPARRKGTGICWLAFWLLVFIIRDGPWGSTSSSICSRCSRRSSETVARRQARLDERRRYQFAFVVAISSGR